MKEEPARDWAQEFAGKPLSEIPDAPPPGLSVSQIVRWKLAQQAAKQAAREGEPIDVRETAPEMSACESDAGSEAEEARHAERWAAIDNLRERIEQAQADLAAPPAHPHKFPAEVREPHQPLTRPAGDAAQLLEHQLASGAALIDYLAHFVARPDTDPATCISFMDRMSSVLGASANIGKVVGRLRGQVSESRQTISVERKAIGGPGAGVLES